ncbi:Cellulose synthase catalytic subunit [UDP-forming] [compost metagenome]
MMRKIDIPARHQNVVDQSMLEPVFCGRQRLFYGVGGFIWLAAVIDFWRWWLQPEHVGNWPLFISMSVVLAWITLIPFYFIVIFFGARRMKASVPPPNGRIAMVVTKAPSEPFSVVRRTLLAMLDQVEMDYDVWLADEDPSEETRKFCSERGVFISTRKGVEAYHRSEWPRRTRCKEGNLAYFYDQYGYDRYDFVAQFDADHVPELTYLREVMKPFSDPAVGYVSAPSICDANAKESWAARGRLYVEASLHGALQVGYNNGWAPLCIGSHYAVRTKALKQIGGLGPELAEDHSTTLMMNAGGWRGVHAVDAIAHGDGPATFADLAVQEFQWSRSLTSLLLQYSPHLIGRLPSRLRFQFVFSQLWYPLFSLFMAVMFAMPLLSLATGRAFAEVSYAQFLQHFMPLSIVLVGLAFFWRSTGLYRPCGAKLFGWEGMLFLLVRWPWSLAGTLMAVRDTLSSRFVDFRITPKGEQSRMLPTRIILPYLALAACSAAAMVGAPEVNETRGFYIFAAINTLAYATVATLIAFRHGRENGMLTVARAKGITMASLCAVAAVLVGGGQLGQHAVGSVEALSYGQNIVSFSETRFTVAGAGHRSRTKITTFRFHWNGFGAQQDI